MTIKVYLVEDNATIRENLTGALEELAPVEVVGFAEEEGTAVRWLERNPAGCDLVLIDIFLKRGSGVGLLQATLGMSWFCKVVVSNYLTKDVRQQCLQLGARRVFDKSSEIEELAEFCAWLDTSDACGGKG